MHYANMEVVTVRPNLIAHRLARNWNQAEAARRAKLARSSYWLIEQGQRDPSLKVANRLSDLFGVPIQELLVDEKERV